jgi:hypothetical protein
MIYNIRVRIAKTKGLRRPSISFTFDVIRWKAVEKGRLLQVSSTCSSGDVSSRYRHELVEV